MRATATGLGAAVLLLAGSMAHAQSGYGPPAGYATCNPSFYASNGSCWYGPNYCFRGPCLPPSPFNGVLAMPNPHGNGLAQAGQPGQGYPPGGAYPPGQGYPPGGAYPPGAGYPPGMGGQPLAGMVPLPGTMGFGLYPPPLAPGFPTHPFARSPRDYFMWGQEHND